MTCIFTHWKMSIGTAEELAPLPEKEDQTRKPDMQEKENFIKRMDDILTSSVNSNKERMSDRIQEIEDRLNKSTRVHHVGWISENSDPEEGNLEDIENNLIATVAGVENRIFFSYAQKDIEYLIKLIKLIKEKTFIHDPWEDQPI